jgi:hypothetical protein
MEQTQGNLISPVPEVPVLEGEVVTAVRGLRERGIKAFARELGVARNTVRRYVRAPPWTSSSGRPRDG